MGTTMKKISSSMGMPKINFKPVVKLGCSSSDHAASPQRPRSKMINTGIIAKAKPTNRR
jgi:hypothetical protein